MSAAAPVQIESRESRSGAREFWVSRGDEIHVIVTQTIECAICEEPHYMFVNRKGRSCCWECDAKFKRAEKAMREGIGDVLPMRGSR